MYKINLKHLAIPDVEEAITKFQGYTLESI